MQAQLHPDMDILREAQKGAYGGTTIEAQRQDWSRYAALLAEPPPPGMKVEDRTLPVPTAPVKVRVYRHQAATGRDPCLVYMHGGGFMKGDLDSSDSVAWGFCALTGATVVSVDYRLTPEHPFPAAFDDSIGTLRHIAANPAEFGIDPARLGVIGDSAGGTLAISLALAARDGIAPALRCQAAIYAGIQAEKTLPSYTENATGFGLTTESSTRYQKLLLSRPEDWTNPYARPVLAKTFAGMAPALVHTAQYDPIRDDGRLYASRLALDGVDVTYREARGMIHGFMRARFKGEGVRAEYQAICDFLRARL
jgi:acetyl esterase